MLICWKCSFFSEGRKNTALRVQADLMSHKENDKLKEKNNQSVIDQKKLLF